ncbi:hypothetical protein HDU96_009088 [Phlyctochytrium bullatum]|nr:hypothetical protein HDU96_009088 [Phlyctochytrium bullatum]
MIPSLRTRAVSLIATGAILTMLLASVVIWPATSHGTYWEMTDHMLDRIDTTFLLSFALPPVAVLLAVHFFLDTDTTGRSIDADKSPSRLTAAIWRARWRLAMGKTVGTWSVGDLLMVTTLVVCNLLWWLVPTVSRLVNNPSPSFELNTRMIFDKLAGWAGWAGIWDGALAIFFALRENHLLKHTLPAEGSQYHVAIRYHIGLGYACLFMETFHSVYYLIVYAIDNTFADSMFPWRTAMGYWNGAGFISWVALVIMSATSVFKVRRWSYRLFYWSHQFYIVFILFSLMHYYVGWYVFVGPLLYFIHDRVSPHLRMHRRQKAHLRTLTPSTLRMDIPLSTLPSHLRVDSFAPGDWVNLCIPSISRLNWHPFSIAGLPSSTNPTLTLVVKSRGAWTQQLHALASAGVPIDVRIEGPFGARGTSYLGHRHLVVVAGGTGMAALIPFVRRYAAAGAGERAVHIVWAIRDARDALGCWEFVKDLAALVGPRGTATLHLTQAKPARVTEVTTSTPTNNTEVNERGWLVADSKDEKKAGSTSPAMEVMTPAATTQSMLSLHRTWVGVNVLLTLACFGAGVGGYAFGRIWVFDFDMAFCMLDEAATVSGSLHFYCWYWYYMAPVLMSAVFALISSLLVALVLPHFLGLGHKPSTAPVPQPSFALDLATASPDDVLASLTEQLRTSQGGAVRIVAGSRPDVADVLRGVVTRARDETEEAAGGAIEAVGLMVAGPERMVRDVSEACWRVEKEVGEGRSRGWVRFYRESFKV